MTGVEEGSIKNLIGSIEDDLKAARTNSGQIRSALEERNTEDDFVLMGLAGYINRWYGAIENIFYRVTVELNGSRPGGERWHEELIRLMTVDIEDLRPSVISQETRTKLDEFRRFRHLVRYDYGGTLDKKEVLQKAKKLLDLHSTVEQEIKEFVKFLKEMLRGETNSSEQNK